jgi:heme/copper-type cytochrome/quinol oxidase subunit 2
MKRMKRFAHETPVFTILYLERIVPANYANKDVPGATRQKQTRCPAAAGHRVGLNWAWLFFYRGGPPKRTVTSLEQVWVPASQTL